ncbi:WalW protein [Altererythrobacter xixiisoli]|uniref:WalW protein n=1 Tax=Croceibacterium xixiisoli TaxID=1476466 RepID=A0A6I4TV52_9SPHN|nr:polysaccharide deacetylase family protein [Croceibacterium xixiisoli]MXO98647.1 WalW protein [Croceibacterium xixiisoli]
MPSLIDPPQMGAIARFDGEFGQRFIVTVDTEEEFDWNKPLQREGHGLRHVAAMGRFQTFCESEGVIPIYLVDWPIVTCEEAIAVLGPAIAAGRAEVGVQLHPWVNPPFDEEVTAHNSFAGNLPPELERAKFMALRDAIEANFGCQPLIYRAGRYGLGPNTAQILHDAGIAIDSSVRSKFDYAAGGGRDYRPFPLQPYWVDAARSLLECPLTTVFWGPLRQQGDAIYPALWRVPRLRGLMSRLGLLERIPLTPEGTRVEEALRGVDIALDDGLPLLVFSFHSPSLDIGHTPYVRDQAGLDTLYGWWQQVFAYLRQRGVAPTSVAGILEAVQR